MFFDFLFDKGHGSKMKGPLSGLVLYLARCGFVDDADLWKVGLQDDDYNTVASKLQEAVEWWDISTMVSGGVIVPKISWYGLVSFGRVDG